MKTDAERSEKLMTSIGEIGEDLILEAANDPPKTKRAKNASSIAARPAFLKRKTLLALIAALLLVSIAVTSVAIVFANRKTPEEDYRQIPRESIPIDGSSYQSAAAIELPDPLKNVKITANGSTDRLIDPESTFRIETAEDCDTALLADYLSLRPAADYSLCKLDGKTFELSPAGGSFDKGTLYRLTVGDPQNPAISYAFQTVEAFDVKGFLPADKVVNAPLDTGIEISFTEEPANVDFSEYVTIEPKVPGTFSLYPNGKTLAFVPSSDLEKDRVYTVTVKEGLPSRSGATLGTSKSVQFRTVNGEKQQNTASISYFSVTFESRRGDSSNTYYSAVSGSALCYRFSPGQNVAIPCAFHFEDISGELEAVTSIYRFPSAEEAFNVLREHEKYAADQLLEGIRYDLSGLELVRTVENSASTMDSTSRRVLRTTVDCGGDLQTGVYLVKLDASLNAGLFGGKHQLTAYTFVQISDLNALTFSFDGKTLVYVTGADMVPVEGAGITGVTYTAWNYWNVDNDAAFTPVRAQSDRSGTAVFETAGSDNAALMIVRKGNDELLLSFCLGEQSDVPVPLKYMYTDREVYFSSDTVRFYGAFYCEDGNPLPEKLYVKAGSSGIKTRITLGDDGSFCGSYSFEDSGRRGLSLSIVDENDQVLSARYVSITQEEKPVVKAEIAFDAPYGKYDRALSGKLTASYFDGTPAPGLTFDFLCRIGGYNYTTRIDFPNGSVTDADGEIAFSIPGTVPNADSTDPLLLYLEAELTGFETGMLVVRSSLPYYHSDYVFGMSAEDDGIAFTLNERDLSGFPDRTVGKAASGRVTVELIRTTLVKHEDRLYDPFMKKTYTSYWCTTDDAVEKTQSVVFKDGAILLPYVDSGRTDVWYGYAVSFYDGHQTFKYRVDAGSLSNHSTGGKQCALTSLRTSCVPGETYRFDARLDGVSRDNVLYVIYNASGILQYTVGRLAEGVYSDEMLPRAQVYAFYPDAESGLYLSATDVLKYDYERAAAISLELTADKAVYKPGETATVRIKADPSASLSQVLVSVVDEACFALGDQKANVLSSLFSSYPYFGRPQFTPRTPTAVGMSYADYQIGGKTVGKSLFLNDFYVNSASNALEDKAVEAPTPESSMDRESFDEGDGGFEYYLRENFKDNPEFRLVALDGNGEGVLVFNVPDNMTTWRVTCCAVSGMRRGIGQIRAGDATTDVICTLPFYITSSVPSVFVRGDDVSFFFRAVGNAAEDVEYNVELRDENDLKIAEKTMVCDPTQRAFFDFGKLEAGSYSVCAFARCGEAADALRRPFTVVESAAVATVRKEIGVSGIKDVAPVLYPVSLTFCDAGASYELFNRIYGYLRCLRAERADVISSAQIADRAYARLYGDKEDAAVYASLLDDLTGTYLRLFQYGEEDAALTARVLSADPTLFSGYQKEQMAVDCYRIMDSGKAVSAVELCSSLALLAALGEPVLNTAVSVCGSAANYSVEAKLYLAMAFAALGDYGSAAGVLEHVFETNAKTNETFGTMYVLADSRDEEIRLTELALIAAARVDKPKAEMLARFIMENMTKAERGLTGLAAYLSYFTGIGDSSPKTVTYRIGEEENTQTVKGMRRVTLVLDKQEFENFEILSCDEGVSLRASYTGTLEDAQSSGDASSRMRIEKSIVETKDNVYTVTLRISVTTTRVYEAFEINDLIPSGARLLFVESARNGGGVSSTNGMRVKCAMRSSSGQNMLGYLSVFNAKAFDEGYRSDCPEYTAQVTVLYSIRGAVPGEFVVESAVIRDASGAFATSERSVLVIKEN